MIKHGKLAPAPVTGDPDFDFMFAEEVKPRTDLFRSFEELRSRRSASYGLQADPWAGSAFGPAPGRPGDAWGAAPGPVVRKWRVGGTSDELPPGLSTGAPTVPYSLSTSSDAWAPAEPVLARGVVPSGRPGPAPTAAAVVSQAPRQPSGRSGRRPLNRAASGSRNAGSNQVAVPPAQTVASTSNSAVAAADIGPPGRSMRAAGPNRHHPPQPQQPQLVTHIPPPPAAQQQQQQLPAQQQQYQQQQRQRLQRQGPASRIPRVNQHRSHAEGVPVPTAAAAPFRAGLGPQASHAPDDAPYPDHDLNDDATSDEVPYTAANRSHASAQAADPPRHAPPPARAVDGRTVAAAPAAAARLGPAAAPQLSSRQQQQQQYHHQQQQHRRQWQQQQAPQAAAQELPQQQQPYGRRVHAAYHDQRHQHHHHEQQQQGHYGAGRGRSPSPPRPRYEDSPMQSSAAAPSRGEQYYLTAMASPSSGASTVATTATTTTGGSPGSVRRQKLQALKARRARSASPAPPILVATDEPDLISIVGYADQAAAADPVWTRSSPTKAPYDATTSSPGRWVQRVSPPDSVTAREGGEPLGSGAATATGGAAGASGGGITAAAGSWPVPRSPEKATQTDPVRLGSSAGQDDTHDPSDQQRQGGGHGESPQRQATNPDGSGGGGGTPSDGGIGGGLDSSKRPRMAELIRKFREAPGATSKQERNGPSAVDSTDGGVDAGESTKGAGDAAADGVGSGVGGLEGGGGGNDAEGGTDESYPVDSLASAVLQRSRALLRERDVIQQRIQSALSKFGGGGGGGSAACGGTSQTLQQEAQAPLLTQPPPVQQQHGAAGNVGRAAAGDREGLDGGAVGTVPRSNKPARDNAAGSCGGVGGGELQGSRVPRLSIALSAPEDPVVAGASATAGGAAARAAGSNSDAGGAGGAGTGSSSGRQAPWRERLRALLAQAGVEPSGGSPPAGAHAAASTSPSSVQPSRPADLPTDPLEAWRQLRQRNRSGTVSTFDMEPAVINPLAAAPAVVAVAAAPAAPVASHMGAGALSMDMCVEGQELVRRFDGTVGSSYQQPHQQQLGSSARNALAHWLEQVSGAAAGRSSGGGSSSNSSAAPAPSGAVLRVTAAPGFATGAFALPTSAAAVSAAAGALDDGSVPSVDDILARLAARFGLAPGGGAALPSREGMLAAASGVATGAGPGMAVAAAAAAAGCGLGGAPNSSGPAVVCAVLAQEPPAAPIAMPPGPGAALASDQRPSGAAAMVSYSGYSAAAGVAGHREHRENAVLLEELGEQQHGSTELQPAKLVDQRGPASLTTLTLAQPPSYAMAEQDSDCLSSDGSATGAAAVVAPAAHVEGRGAHRRLDADFDEAATDPWVTNNAAASGAVAGRRRATQTFTSAQDAAAAAAAILTPLAPCAGPDPEQALAGAQRESSMGDVVEEELEISEDDVEAQDAGLSWEGPAGGADGGGAQWPQWLASLGIPRPVEKELIPPEFRASNSSDGGGGGGAAQAGLEQGMGGGNAEGFVARNSEAGLQELGAEEPVRHGIGEAVNGAVSGRGAVHEGEKETAEEAQPADRGSPNGSPTSPAAAEGGFSTPLTRQPRWRRLGLQAGSKAAQGAVAGSDVSHAGSSSSFTPVLGSLLSLAVGEGLFADTPPSHGSSSMGDSRIPTAGASSPTRAAPSARAAAAGLPVLAAAHDGMLARSGGGRGQGPLVVVVGTTASWPVDADAGDEDEDGVPPLPPWRLGQAEPEPAADDLSPRGRGGDGAGLGRARGSAVSGPGHELRASGDLASSIASSGGGRFAAILQHTVTAALFGDSPSASLNLSSSMAAANFPGGVDGSDAEGENPARPSSGSPANACSPATRFARCSSPPPHEVGPASHQLVTAFSASSSAGPLPEDPGPMPFNEGTVSDGSDAARGFSGDGSERSEQQEQQQQRSSNSSDSTVVSEVYEEDFVEPSPPSSASEASAASAVRAALQPAGSIGSTASASLRHQPQEQQHPQPFPAIRMASASAGRAGQGGHAWEHIGGPMHFHGAAAARYTAATDLSSDVLLSASGISGGAGGASGEYAPDVSGGGGGGGEETVSVSGDASYESVSLVDLGLERGMDSRASAAAALGARQLGPHGPWHQCAVRFEGSSADDGQDQPSSSRQPSGSPSTASSSIADGDTYPTAILPLSIDLEDLIMFSAAQQAAAAAAAAGAGGDSSGLESVRSSAAAAAAAAALAAGMAFSVSSIEDIMGSAAAASAGSSVLLLVDDPPESLLFAGGGRGGGVSGGDVKPMGRRVPAVTITEVSSSGGSSAEEASASDTAGTDSNSGQDTGNGAVENEERVQAEAGIPVAETVEEPVEAPVPVVGSLEEGAQDAAGTVEGDVVVVQGIDSSSIAWVGSGITAAVSEEVVAAALEEHGGRGSPNSSTSQLSPSGRSGSADMSVPHAWLSMRGRLPPISPRHVVEAQPSSNPSETPASPQGPASGFMPPLHGRYPGATSQLRHPPQLHKPEVPTGPQMPPTQQGHLEQPLQAHASVELQQGQRAGEPPEQQQLGWSHMQHVAAGVPKAPIARSPLFNNNGHGEEDIGADTSPLVKVDGVTAGCCTDLSLLAEPSFSGLGRPRLLNAARDTQRASCPAVQVELQPSQGFRRDDLRSGVSAAGVNSSSRSGSGGTGEDLTQQVDVNAAAYRDPVLGQPSQQLAAPSHPVTHTSSSSSSTSASAVPCPWVESPYQRQQSVSTATAEPSLNSVNSWPRVQDHTADDASVRHASAMEMVAAATLPTTQSLPEPGAQSLHVHATQLTYSGSHHSSRQQELPYSAVPAPWPAPQPVASAAGVAAAMPLPPDNASTSTAATSPGMAWATTRAGSTAVAAGDGRHAVVGGSGSSSNATSAGWNGGRIAGVCLTTSSTAIAAAGAAALPTAPCASLQSQPQLQQQQPAPPQTSWAMAASSHLPAPQGRRLPEVQQPAFIEGLPSAARTASDEDEEDVIVSMLKRKMDACMDKLRSLERNLRSPEPRAL